MDRKTKRRSAPKRGARRTPLVRDRHYLYSAAVQSPDVDLAFFRRVWRAKHGRPFHLLREDFCGTAALAHEWVRRGRENLAWGVDLDGPTLAWARKHYTPKLGPGRERLQLIQGNVLDSRNGPRVEVVTALNFSYSVMHTREQLAAYFARVRASLVRGGMFILDAWGGFDILREDTERRRIATERAWDETRVPGFKYRWEQVRFNPIDHRMRCHIHFELADGTKLERAFTYEWRLWMLPELIELLGQAGFTGTEVYIEGWDEDENESDGIFRRKSYFENQEGWVAYLVASA